MEARMGVTRALTAAAASRAAVRPGSRKAVAFAAAVGFIALNLAIYVIPIDYRMFGAWAYPGVFLLLLLATAAMVVPVPYVPVLVHVMQTADSLALVVAAASLASALGESTGWLVGRAEKGLVADHPMYKRIQRFAGSPRRTALIVFALAAPPNPVFDLAGLAAGALGMPYRLFFISVLTGRVVRFAALAWMVHALGV